MTSKFKTTSKRENIPLNHQSVELGNCTRRLTCYEDALVKCLSSDITTAYHSFKHSVEKYGNRQCLGFRPIRENKVGAYEFITYNQAYIKIKYFASGLIHIGVQPTQHLGIYSKNRMEWQLVSEACHTQSIVTIALYDTLGEDASLYIMNHGEIVCLCISLDELPKVKQIATKCSYLKNLIIFEDIDDIIKKEYEEFNIKVFSFSEIEQKGKNFLMEDVIPSPNTLATIMYTSGTTGTPKGVMLSHANLIAAISGISHSILQITPQDVLVSYLPLAHILERVAELTFFQRGASIGFTRGIRSELLCDIQALKPTFFPAVPRILDVFYNKICSTIDNSNKIKKWLFNKAMQDKKNRSSNSNPTIFEKLVINKLKNMLGGRVRGMLSGGAPLRPKVHEFIKLVFDCSLVQGYGLTETTAAGTISLYNDHEVGHIGPPLACCEIKLLSVPELDYHHTNDPPMGEICIRGPNVFGGYFKEPEKTREVLDDDGWFHTGDIGKLNSNGTFTIIDRVKNIFKMSQGEYVAPECLETKLMIPLLNRLWIYGDSLKNQLVAIGVVNLDAILAWTKLMNIDGNFDQLTSNEKVIKFVLGELESKGKEIKLRGFEFVKAIHLVTKDFDTVDGTTPTMKLKRNVLKNVFKNEIEKMYGALKQED